MPNQDDLLTKISGHILDAMRAVTDPNTEFTEEQYAAAGEAAEAILKDVTKGQFDV